MKAFIKKIWCPTYAAKSREQLFEFTLKNMLVYIVFLIVVSGIILGRVPPLRYTYTDVMKKQFIYEKFKANDDEESISINFYGIKSAEDLWVYLEKIISVYLYNEYWYSWRLQIAETSLDDKKVMFENKILGVPRLRQVRVRNDTCLIHAQFQKTFASCYGEFNDRNEDKSTFGLRMKPAWNYNKPQSYFRYKGRVAKYHTGGYYHDLGTTRNQTEEIIKNLKDNLWIQRNTRAVFLDFTMYNGNLNLFCIVKLVFEFPPTGGILPMCSFYPADLLRYNSIADYFILGLELVAICFIIYYTIVEICTMQYLGRYYFSYCWNYIEIFILLVAYVTISFGIFRYFYVAQQIAKVHKNPNTYASYESVGYVHRHVSNFLSITLFVLWMKIFKFINLSRTLGQLNTTLSRCVRDVVGFSVMFFIIFLAFAQVGFLLFGGDVEIFSTFADALMTLLMTILGEFNYYSIEDSHPELAPLFFITYIVLVFFVLINMFLAIITDTYAEVKEEIKLKKMDLELDDYVIRNSIGKWLRSSSTSFPGAEIIDKIRNILKTCNFSYVEIQAFFSRYDFRDEKKVTREDLDQLLSGIKKSIDENVFAPDIMAQISNANKITMDAFIAQQDQIELLEYQVEAIRKKLDEILNKKQPGLYFEDQ